ncbi:hypothetical protein BDZ90DRAFT_54608 [Jaminaea rosea]|uniref:EI24-domain-containing protein n=1 Tax=Jaminaea rosea TaxID=1569628 RepID=A0A316UL28_9BASI|nr:hypothetical protein BDZ90DRAFT_54608 [Jaminaea rosea]PWN25949.1 hypothetical protein BDZ90DRAFT_54608 [Jaminaea rosea]
MAHFRGLSSLDLTSVDVEGGPGAARLDDDYFVGLPLLSSSHQADLPWTAAGPASYASSSSASAASTLSLQALGASVRQHLGYARAGWTDSLRWRQVAHLVVESSAVRLSMIKGLILSSAVVLIIFFFELAFFPAQLYPRSSPSSSSTKRDAAGTWSETSSVLWLYPVIAISYYMASSWTLDVAKTAYQLQAHRRAFSTSFSASSFAPSANLRRRILLQSYQPLLFINYALLALLVRNYVPFVGPALAFGLISAVDAFYCFDPVMASRGWPIERRLRYVESRWAYMTTFGLLPTAVSYFHPSGLVNLFLFMAIYPFCTVLALLANPLPRSSEGSKGGSAAGTPKSAFLPARIPLFLPTAILYRIAMRFAPPAGSDVAYLEQSASRYGGRGAPHQSFGAAMAGKTPGVAAYGGGTGGAAGFYSGGPAYGGQGSVNGMGYGQDASTINGWAGGAAGTMGNGGAASGGPALGRRTAAQFVGGVWQGQGQAQQASRWGAGPNGAAQQAQQPYAAFTAAQQTGAASSSAATPARRTQQVHLPQQARSESPDVQIGAVLLNGAGPSPGAAPQHATYAHAGGMGAHGGSPIKVGPPPKGPARGGGGGGKKVD